MVKENPEKGSGQTPSGPKLPPDIQQDRKLNRFIGLSLIAAAMLPLMPIYTTIKHTGFSRVGDWPDVFYAMALLSVVFVAFGVRLMFVSRPLSAGVTFHSGGFTIRVRRSFDMRDERFDWSDIAEVGLESFGNHRSYFIRRIGKPKQAYAAIHLAVNRRDFFARLHASAEDAGYRLEKKGIDLFLYEKQVWTVRRADASLTGD
jgi:hypothetical protein